MVLFLEYLVFFRAFFISQNNSTVPCRMGFCMFLAFLIFDSNWPFCKGYSLCMGYTLAFERGPILKIFISFFHFSNIWCFFKRFFAKNNSNVFVERFEACFWHFLFLTQTDHSAKAIAFAWAIAFTRWPIFEIFSFFEHFVFLESFLHKTTLRFL